MIKLMKKCKCNLILKGKSKFSESHLRKRRISGLFPFQLFAVSDVLFQFKAVLK